jgi:light-regulated signal transduction histidine kinase (bacteriophytochrome)
MGKLIDDLLNLSRVSRIDLEKKTVDLTLMASSICDRFRKTDPSRKVEFTVGEGLSAPGDQLLLQQMIGNLLENSWKYTAKQPAARIEFGKEVIGGEDTFYVRDNGVGFDMEYKDNLFGAFQRLHGAEYEGNGIGLATVKRIIDRHSGSVWAESGVDRGATFYFRLGEV